MRSTIGDIVARSARRTPTAMALTFEDRVWTYRELDDGSNRVAAMLLGLGLKKGDRVAAFGKNSDAYLLLWLGVVKAGLIHVPVNYALQGRELAYLLNQSGARAVFVDTPLRPALVKAYYGASIMPTPILQRLRALLPNLGFWNCFGQSEIGPLATVLRPEEHEARPASAGRAIPFVDMRVVDDDMKDVPAGEVGEVVYRSPQLCLGYWEKPEETKEAFEGGWFHSGDLARIDAEGYITIVDRKKDVIKTGGVMVSSREVEEALFTHPAVAEVAVIPLPHPKWIEAVTAVVVCRAGQSTDEASLIEHAKKSLSPFKVPKAVHFIDQLPKNTAGKLLKRELKARFAK